MSIPRPFRRSPTLRPLLCLTFLAGLIALAAPAPAQSPPDLLEQSGVPGGLVVQVGCDDASSVAALRRDESCKVLALDVDAAAVEEARKAIKKAGAYGDALADQFDGKRLPLIDNVANLVIVAEPFQNAEAECRRVLCPEGVAFVKTDGGWKQIGKPRPEEIDVWTHFLHDPSNNAVAQDKIIDVPRRLQWTGGPRYSRHHDHMASMSAMVSNGPQVFYIIDMGSRWSIELPADWRLVARDAFNGTILWNKPMGEWFTHHYSLKSGPGDLPRRLVAVGDEVYFTPAIDAPLEKVHAATGKTLKRYGQTAATEEIVYDDGILFLKVNRPDNQIEFETIQEARRNNGGVPFDLDPRRIMAVDAESGETLWQRESVVMPTTLAVDDKRAYYHDGEKVVALDRESGEELWTQAVPRWSKMLTFFTPTLVVYEGIVLFAGGEEMIPHRGGKDTMTAMDAESGKVLWTAEHGPSGYQSAEDLLVSGGLVWCGETTSGGYSGAFTGRDPKTGEVKKQFAPEVDTYWFHHRCYRGKATEDFLLMSRTGIEFVDPKTESWTINHWVRGGCLYGIMPCNGLVYAPPSNCACYPEVKLYGFNALAPAAPEGHAIPVVAEAKRLQRGPAYGVEVSAAQADDSDWPTYRGDKGRSGDTDVKLPAELKVRWKAKAGGRLTAPVVAAGRIFVADVDRHEVKAVSAEDGKAQWSFTAGGRVDSPPTVYRGRVYFGCADGYVYCVTASDGRLVWRYLAAPCDQRFVAYNQVESVWPVRGSVLIEEDKLYTIAGRNVFLDGGLRLVILDPATGKLLGENPMDDRDPKTGENLQSHVMILNMPTGLNDILSSDGKNIYLKSQVIDKKGKRGDLGPHSGQPAEQGSVQIGETAHLYAPFGGFIDGDWFHRSYWVYGRSFAGGHAGYYQAGKFTPSGRILVFDDDNVYGYGRKPQYYKWTTPLEHQLFCADKQPLEAEVNRRGEPSNLVEVPIKPALNPAKKALAVEAWVKPERAEGVVIARGGPAQGFALVIRGGKPKWLIRSDNELYSVSAEKKVVGEWHHLAGVLTEDKKMKVFVDGELAGTAQAERLIASEPAQGMEIGSDEQSAVGDYKSPMPWKGLIDDVKLYFGEVTDEQIARHAAEGPEDAKPEKAELVFHATFDDGKRKDVSGKGNHAKVAGLESAAGKFGKALQFPGKRPKPAPKYFVVHKWTRDVPLYVRAMAKADDKLFIMGPPDFINEDEIFTSALTPEVNKELAAQDAAIRGKQGAILMTVSAADGEVLAERKIDALPQWDGMAAADGNLFVVTEAGEIICLGE